MADICHILDPVADGQVTQFPPPDGKRARNLATKFYYVNGINTTGSAHRITATVIADIVEDEVTGIYNLTNGMLADLSQCVGDWINIVRSQLGEQGFFRDRLTQSMITTLAGISLPMRLSSPYLHAMREAYVAPAEIQPRTEAIEEIRKSLARNQASLSLFDELRQDLGRSQIVIAHSQGNLITSFTLWALQAVYGTAGLQNLQIRSISSPSPAWPRGINHRIKVYGQKDDPVTLADPKNWSGNRSLGFWDRFVTKSPGQYVKSGGIAAHDVEYNIKQTSLADRLRDDAGLAPFPKEKWHK